MNHKSYGRLDIEVEFDVDVEEAVPFEETPSEAYNEAYEALLEEKAHLDLQYDQLRQRCEVCRKKTNE